MAQTRRVLLKRILLLFIDLCIILFSTIVAVALRDNFETTTTQLMALLPYLGITLATSIPVLLLFGANRMIWRLSSMPDYISVALASVVIVMLSVGSGFLINRLEGVARSLPILQAIMMIVLLVGVRILSRLRDRRRRSARLRSELADFEVLA